MTLVAFVTVLVAEEINILPFGMTVCKDVMKSSHLDGVHVIILPGGQLAPVVRSLGWGRL